MNRSFLLSVLTAALAMPEAQAQIPDTTTAARYYPLAVGNEWHTQGTLTETGQPLITRLIRHFVVGEAPGEPGHYVVETTTVQSVGSSPPTTAHDQAVWHYDPATDHVRQGATSLTWCRLNAPFVATVACEIYGTMNVGGGYGAEVEVGGETVVTSEKVFHQYGSSPSGSNAISLRFAAGVGPFEFRRQTIWPNPTYTERVETWRLRYARVGGVATGTPLFTVSSEQDTATRALALTAFPNPVRQRGSVAFSIAAAGDVRLVAYDVLGRVAAVLAEGPRPAGAHDAAFDASGLASGTYILLLETGGEVATRRITVLR